MSNTLELNPDKLNGAGSDIDPRNAGGIRMIPDSHHDRNLIVLAMSAEKLVSRVELLRRTRQEGGLEACSFSNGSHSDKVTFGVNSVPKDVGAYVKRLAAQAKADTGAQIEFEHKATGQLTFVLTEATDANLLESAQFFQKLSSHIDKHIDKKRGIAGSKSARDEMVVEALTQPLSKLLESPAVLKALQEVGSREDVARLFQAAVDRAVTGSTAVAERPVSKKSWVKTVALNGAPKTNGHANGLHEDAQAPGSSIRL